MTDDEKKKDKFPPPGPAPKPRENLLSMGKDKVILSNGMSMEEIANDPELSKEYSDAQWKLYLQKLRNLKKNGS